MAVDPTQLAEDQEARQRADITGAPTDEYKFLEQSFSKYSLNDSIELDEGYFEAPSVKKKGEDFARFLAMTSSSKTVFGMNKQMKQITFCLENNHISLAGISDGNYR